jgi:hypothetical protein
MKTIIMTRDDVGDIIVNDTPEDIAEWQSYGFVVKQEPAVQKAKG